ncbi:MAG: DUF362 domain-containing protein [Promethearchaeota archaeon]|nr:MAG: DUF362 domain-containing protein [Candidatus Lokiarchaeota archaeon]
MEQSNSEYTNVVISKGENPKDCVLNGIDKLGGISNIIKEGDQVFIKFNLTLPQGFPSHTNIDTLEAIIEACNEAGAKKVYLGSFPIKGMTINIISDFLGLKKYFLKIGAELVFLDNSNYYYEKNLSKRDLQIIKSRNFSKINLNGKEFLFPKLILESDKYISVNQVNVDPVFNLRLSILNSYSSTINNFHDDIIKTDNLKDLISLVLDVYSLRKPDLAINDIFYILEGAGPFIYKDSNLKKTGLMVIGNNAIEVDMTTLKLIDTKNILYEEALNRNLGFNISSQIKFIGENPDNIKINIKECISELNSINLPNFSIKSGKMSLGDFEQAYHLLNFLKTSLIKDIKYISKVSFLIGEDPPEPEFFDKIIIFGDAAIKTTKLKKNLKILKLPGDPPNFLECIRLFVNFFGKGKAPLASYFHKINKYNTNQKLTKRFNIWEGL